MGQQKLALIIFEFVMNTSPARHHESNDYIVSRNIDSKGAEDMFSNTNTAAMLNCQLKKNTHETEGHVEFQQRISHLFRCKRLSSSWHVKRIERTELKQLSKHSYNLRYLFIFKGETPN